MTARTCPVCSGPIPPERRRRPTCSIECQRAANAAARQARTTAAHSDPDTGQPDPGGQLPSGPGERPDTGQPDPGGGVRVCEACGAAIPPGHLVRLPDTTGCSHECRKRLKRRRKKARQRERAAA